MQLTIFRSMRLIPFLGITLLLCHQFHAALVYRVYYNRFLGAVTLSFNDFGNIRTTAFEIDLRRFVPAFGGQRLPWDRNYDAARRLFGPSLAGKALRLIGRETYRQLFYYGESGGIWEGRHLKMIMNEGQRLGKPRLFNYAFTVGGALRFVEMGTFFTRDQVSKHSILANVEEETYCAGEMFWDGDVLVISNASGTYTPPMTNVQALASILQQELKGLSVRVMKYNDADYIRMRSRMTI